MDSHVLNEKIRLVVCQECGYPEVQQVENSDDSCPACNGVFNEIKGVDEFKSSCHEFGIDFRPEWIE